MRFLRGRIVLFVVRRLWGLDHDFTIEEVLSEIAYFRGESYHTIRECGEERADETSCIRSNFSDYAKMVRSGCDESIDFCKWNDKEFECCAYFRPVQTELGVCYALNSIHIQEYPLRYLLSGFAIDLLTVHFSYETAPRLDMTSNKYTGPGALYMEILTEANVMSFPVCVSSGRRC